MMPRPHRNPAGKAMRPTTDIATDIQSARIAVRVALRREGEPDEASLPGSDPREARLSRRVRPTARARAAGMTPLHEVP